jgi:hypothetical protein
VLGRLGRVALPCRLSEIGNRFTLQVRGMRRLLRPCIETGNSHCQAKQTASRQQA